uniref:CHC2 zinc finger domain-containing protein n=1 Tax=Prevotella sp. TaxID=59823 RepID=UPI004028DB1B
MNKEQLQRLRSLPVEAVAERLGLRVVRHKSLCPFHDDHHASLSFSPSRNTFRCFVCDARGGTIDLVMRHLNMSFPDACRWLANGTNIILDTYRPRTPTVDRPARPFDAARYARLFEHPWLSDEARTFLFTERRLNPRVVSWCRLTSWTDRQGTHWLQTPYFDASGQLIGLQNRNLDYGKQKGDEGEETGADNKQGQGSESREAPRFRFPYGSRCTVYNLPVTAMLRPGEPLFITEGCSDCWAMLSAGHKAIAIPSATLLSQADKALLRDLAQRLGTSFHMFPDRDAPGERLFMQLREVLPGLQHHQLPVGCKDFAEYYVSALAKNKLGGYG